MRAGTGRLLPLRLAVAASVLTACSLTALASAADGGPRERADALRQRQAELGQRQHRALLDLYAAQAAVARAQASLAGLRARQDALGREADSAATRADVVRRSLAASQARVGRALRMLYIEGETSPVEILLGATSLDEALLGIESLSLTAEQNRRLAREAGERGLELRALRAELEARQEQLGTAVEAAEAAAAALEREASARAATIASLEREGSLTRAEIAELDERAREAERASARLAPSPAPTPRSPEPAVATAGATATGTRTLVVDAVAYHLPGLTASGIPVGPGVIAVDPTVIPLGTRVFVPGYGPAVAADVGTAIKGAIIDLWMPSTAKALEWGRRTVTITIYG